MTYKRGDVVDLVIVCDNIATVLDAQIDAVVGHCPIMQAVETALKTVLALQ